MFKLIANATIRLPVNFWDKGADALQAFVVHHECNSLCIALELDELSDFDINEIARHAEAEKVKATDHARMDGSGGNDVANVAPQDLISSLGTQ